LNWIKADRERWANYEVLIFVKQMKVADITNKTGCTPLALAFANEHVECCNLLRTAQAPLAPEPPDVREIVNRSEKDTTVDQTTELSAATSRRISEQTSMDGEQQQSGIYRSYYRPFV
jgi:hypothetical protein